MLNISAKFLLNTKNVFEKRFQSTSVFKNKLNIKKSVTERDFNSVFKKILIVKISSITTHRKSAVDVSFLHLILQISQLKNYET